MKKLIFGLLFFSASAFSQINLDQPVLNGMGDQIYAAYNEPNAYYFFPQQLCRISEPEVRQVGERLISEFHVGLCKTEVERVTAALIAKGIQNPSVRVFRGLSAQTEASSLADSFGTYDPKVETLSDPGDFGGKIIYRISLYSGLNWISERRANRVMRQIFSDQPVSPYVQIQFSFNGIMNGQHQSLKSAVSVFLR
jgi:hypothetical protein